MTVESLCNYRK